MINSRRKGNRTLGNDIESFGKMKVERVTERMCMKEDKEGVMGWMVPPHKIHMLIS